MADMWGKLILAALGSAAIWKGIGPNGQQQVIEALNKWAEEGQRKKQEEERQRLAVFNVAAAIIVVSFTTRERTEQSIGDEKIVHIER